LTVGIVSGLPAFGKMTIGIVEFGKVEVDIEAYLLKRLYIGRFRGPVLAFRSQGREKASSTVVPADDAILQRSLRWTGGSGPRKLVGIFFFLAD
jgi:hypothetical protein